MSNMNIEVVTRETHSAKKWLGPTHYGFAAQETIVPLGLNEVPAAMLAMPLCIVQAQGAMQLVGLMGLQNGENLLVGANGAWLGTYVPTTYACYPFLRARAEDGSEVLCVRTEGLVAVGESRGERFYDAEGTPTEALQRIVNRLGDHEPALRRAQTACAMLEERGLLEPWPIQVRSGDKTVVVGDLYRVNEARLNELPAEALLQLRNAGALLLAYSQLLSMAQIQALAKIAFSRKANERQPPPPFQLGGLTDDHGLISFSNL